MRKASVSWLVLLALGILLQPLTGEAQGPGSYPGVVPGSGNSLPRVTQLKGQSGTWVTWPGFLALPDGSSRIFLQTTGPISYERADEPKKIVVKLGGASVFLSNNRNALETQHFNTPVTRAYLKTIKKKLTLVVELRATVAATITQFAESDGYNYIVIDFPAGKYQSSSQAPAVQ